MQTDISVGRMIGSEVKQTAALLGFFKVNRPLKFTVHFHVVLQGFVLSAS